MPLTTFILIWLKPATIFKGWRECSVWLLLVKDLTNSAGHSWNKYISRCGKSRRVSDNTTTRWITCSDGCQTEWLAVPIPVCLFGIRLIQLVLPHMNIIHRWLDDDKRTQKRWNQYNHMETQLFLWLAFFSSFFPSANIAVFPLDLFVDVIVLVSLWIGFLFWSLRTH